MAFKLLKQLVSEKDALWMAQSHQHLELFQTHLQTIKAVWGNMLAVYASTSRTRSKPGCTFVLKHAHDVCSFDCESLLGKCYFQR